LLALAARRSMRAARVDPRLCRVPTTREGMMAETTTSTKRDDGGAGRLDEFLTAAEAFVANVSQAMLRAAGEDEDAVLIEGTSRMVIAQFGSVTREARTAYQGASAAGRRDADRLLAIQQGTLIARTGEETALSALARGPGRGFFGWVSQHLEELKKLIRFIFEAITGSVPGWLEKLLRLIDELWDLISSLLSGIFGLNRREIADEISARAVNTMNELTALARLGAAGRPVKADDND
jgi:hypothetical protein